MFQPDNDLIFQAGDLENNWPSPHSSCGLSQLPGFRLRYPVIVFSFEGFKPFKFVNNIEFQACKIQKLYPPLSCKNHTLHSRWDKTNYQRQNYASNLMHKLGISCDTQWIWAGANFQQDPKDNGLKQLDSRFCFETASQASQPICLSFHTLQRFISSNEPPRCVLVRQHVSVCGTEWRWAMGQNL